VSLLGILRWNFTELHTTSMFFLCFGELLSMKLHRTSHDFNGFAQRNFAELHTFSTLKKLHNDFGEFRENFRKLQWTNEATSQKFTRTSQEKKLHKASQKFHARKASQGLRKNFTRASRAPRDVVQKHIYCLWFAA